MTHILNPYRYSEENPYAENLLAYFRFHNSLDDEVGNTSPTSAFTAYTDGIYSGNPNEAIEFLGNLSEVIIGDYDFLSFTEEVSPGVFSDLPFSFVTCVKVNTVQGVNQLILKQDTGGSGDFEYSWFFGGGAGVLKPIIQLRDSSTGGYLRGLYNTSLSGSTAYTLGMTYSGNGLFSGINMYVDGANVPLLDQSSGTYVAMQNTSYPVKFGINANSTIFGLKGDLNGTGIFDKALSASEMSDIHTILSSGGDLL